MSELNKNAFFVDAEIIPHVFYQVYGKNQKWMHDDEVVYYSFDAGTYVEEDEEKPVGTSSISINPVAESVEKNKHFASSEVEVTITPGAKLVELYPMAVVSIDGKNHDLGVLANPITFNMDKDHRVSIHWVAGSLVETFRICVNR